MRTTFRSQRPKTAVRGIFFLAIIAAVIFVGRSVEAAPESTFTVNTTADIDDGSCDVLDAGVSDCSLREAINAAEANSGTDFINFNIPEKDAGCSADNVCTIVTGSTLPSITDISTTTINGNGADITIDGGSAVRPFDVAATGTLKLRLLTVANGSATAGGAVINGGDLELYETTFISNQARSGSGGAVYNVGVLTVLSSTFEGNHAPDEVGGAIRNNGGLMTVNNSTFSDNSAGKGGAIYADSGTITHSTFYGNGANSGGAVSDSGSAAPLTLANSVLASSTSGGNCDTDSGGIIGDGDGNISSDGTCGFSAGSSVNSLNPQLNATLADNGGPTETHALLAGSPAIDTASVTSCLAYDQRGERRPQGLGCDKGAYEVVVPIGTDFVINSSESTDDGYCDVLVPGIADCTLHEALDVANSQSGDNTITFDIPAADSGCSADNVCVITLITALSGINDSSGKTILDGTGVDITIDGNHSMRIFSVANNASLTLRELTISNGESSDSQGGGAITNLGTLDIERCFFSGNSRSGGPGDGGGAINGLGSLTIDNSTFSGNNSNRTGGAISAGGTLLVTNSTFVNNEADISGGAMIFSSIGTKTISNSTFSGNKAGTFGGAVHAYDGSITNSTFVGNNATGGGSVIDVNATTPLTLANSVLAGGSDGNCSVHSGGTISDGGGNISDDGTCGFSGDNLDPLLDPNLADNGGPTQTHALYTSSPAIDATATPCALSFDQRGVARPQGTGCDSGAYEYESSVVAQQIPLSTGWDLVSLNVQPADPSFVTILGGLVGDYALLKNGAGEVYWPDYGVDQIGAWQVREAYQIYMTNAASLSVSGYKARPVQTPIALDAGWNMVAYVRDSAMAMKTATKSIGSELVLVKNGDGQVFWPDMNINDIGNMQPGQGYQMYLNSPAVLTYPAN